MSRDKILGLALGILVLGFTGAFCFRPEKRADDPIPRLNNPARLDRQIAEKSVMPYLTGVEGVEANANSADANPASRTVDQPPLWQKPAFLGQDQGRDTRPADSPAVSQAPPDPIPPIQVDTLGQNHNTAWQPPPKRSEPSPPQTQQPATYTKRTHRVERGETLSELAVKYLGSSARYMEIYEANSDILANPHNLRPGMIIRIPAPQTAKGPADAINAQPVSTRGTQQDSAVELLPGPEETGARERFRPVRHSPLMPGNSRTSQEDSPKPATKRLSQIPPTGFPGIDNLLSIINGALNQTAADALKNTTAAAPNEESQTR